MKMLVVPYFKQETDASCAAASLRMFFGYYGLSIDESEIRSFANTTKEGTSREEIIDALEEYDFWCVDGVEGKIGDITAAIDKGHPILVDWYLWPEREGHYSVIYGMGRRRCTSMIHQIKQEAKFRIGTFSKHGPMIIRRQSS